MNAIRTGIRFVLLIHPLLALELAAQSNWVRSSPPASPPSRNSTAMVYDAARARSVLFGGFRQGNPSYLADTWEWDGSNWTQRSPVSSPPARNGHAMAYDPARGRTVLFGGVTTPTLSDTWEWDGTNWTQSTPVASPPGRYNHYLCYDGVRRRVLLFGGQNGAANFGDTWEWDGSNWSQLTPAASPSARPYHAMAYDTARGRAVLFGGGVVAAQLNDTWEWNGVNWTQLTPAHNPTPRLDHEMVFDAARGRVLLFGGYSSLADTWEWDGTDWTQITTAAAPSGRYAYGFAYDTTRERAVLFGGYSNGQVADTWEYVSLAPASYTTFGAGCTGSAGTPLLAAALGNRPWAGDVFTARVSQARAASAALLFVGFSRTTWLGIPLPLNLASVGAPLCNLLVAGNTVLVVGTDAGGNGAIGIPVPVDPTIVGGRFFQQYAVLDPGANGLGFVFSNGGEGVIGAR